MEKWEYCYETVVAEPDKAGEKLNSFLNQKGGEGWELVSLNYCHDYTNGKLVKDYAACLFKRKGRVSETTEAYAPGL
ncbi:MAG: DUF4177 domain-containing protein [Candidatus Tectomicrobia bacterium]|uniref:DUF4177 domain-containing protein n=1 Tax=Tectimicrobiota bacterium TaxID=2528274 RepID=A0A932CPB0_UNCTE|nr:DUF4177 domain-containing protein [Candidatus Tectomicrobia bacterium]